jgi:hypothetical protein
MKSNVLMDEWPDGSFLFKFGLEACENGLIQYATELASSSCDQYIFFCYCNKHHIQALNGDFIKSYASNGAQYNYLFGIYTSASVQIIINEAEYARVQILD